MKAFVRGLAALALAGAALAGNVAAQDQATLDTPREKASYMVGLDVARSLAPAGPDLDVAAFERAVRHAFEGGEPLIAEDKVQPLAEVLMTRIAARDGKPPAGGLPLRAAIRAIKASASGCTCASCSSGLPPSNALRTARSNAARSMSGPAGAIERPTSRPTM